MRGGGEPEVEGPEDCVAGEIYNTVLKRCVTSNLDAGREDASGGEDASGEDTSGEDASGGEDASVEEDVFVDDGCDEDRDGARSIACGGADCDDRDFRRSPDRAESCDSIDNNCDGQVNEGISCTFFAHSGDTLYTIDPFKRVAEAVGEVPGLQDIDTHPDGTLYGVTREELYRFDGARRRWTMVGTFPARIEDANGLAIDSAGVGYVTSGDSLYEVDLGTARTQLIGVVGETFYSSGDCVVNKRDSLFMTSKAEDQPDTLVLVNRMTGEGVELGSVGFSRVFGLTAGWDALYGLTSEGQLITLDSRTGQGTLVHTFEGLRWYGAASTPAR